MCRKSDTAIIYFALSANEDLKQNRFSGSRVHRQLISKLHRRTLKSIRSTGLPVLSFNEENQVGDNLAERLTNAFAQAFAKGFQNVIALGNDTPDLDADLINQAADELTSGKAVLGPSADGGNYLIGLRAQEFSEGEFCAAIENSDETNARLRTLLENYRELKTLSDIDDEKSLYSWLRSSSAETEKIIFRKEILSAVLSTTPYEESLQIRPENWSLYTISDRAPPLALVS